MTPQDLTDLVEAMDAAASAWVMASVVTAYAAQKPHEQWVAAAAVEATRHQEYLTARTTVLQAIKTLQT